MKVIDCGQYDNIISWSTDGLSFVIHKPMSLIETKDGSALVPYVISDNNEDSEGNSTSGPKFKSFLRKVRDGHQRRSICSRLILLFSTLLFHQRFSSSLMKAN